MMKIDRIIAYGCSLTAGDELGDEYFFGPGIEEMKKKYFCDVEKCYGDKWEELKKYNRTISWPNYVAEKLGVECVNRAQSGSNLGNVIFKILDDYYSNKITENDLILVGLSSPGRFFYFVELWGEVAEATSVFNYPEAWPHPELCEVLLKYYVNDYNLMWEYCRDKHHLQLISNLLGNRVKMFSLLSIEERWKKEFPDFDEKYPHLKHIDCQDHLMRGTSIYDICEGDVLGWNHPPLKYHIQFADLVYDELKRSGVIDD